MQVTVLLQALHFVGIIWEIIFPFHIRPNMEMFYFPTRVAMGFWMVME